MDEDSANVFISTLVKNIQMLCYGHVAFNQNVEVIGHLYLNIDSGKKLNYVVNEKCSKLNESTTFTSNSFHAEPKTAQEKKKATETGYINHVAAASMGNWQARSRKKKITSARSFVESPAKIPKISEPIDLHLTTDVADSIDESLGVTFPSQDTYTNDSDDGNGPSSDYSNFKVKTEAIENDLTAAHSLSSIKIENVSSLEGGGGDESFHASSSAFNPNDSSSQLYSPVRTDDIRGSTAIEAVRFLQTIQSQKIPEKEIEYAVIEMGTQMGRPLLIDNMGYSYTIRCRTGNVVRWRCSQRCNSKRCSASVTQHGEEYKRGAVEHLHEAKPSLLPSTLVAAEARAQALNDFVSPVSEVIERALSVNRMMMDVDASLLPNQDYDDFPMAAAKSVLNVSGFPAQEVLYSKDPSIQPLLGNIIKEASIQCGIWEDAPYPRDIPMPIREMFFDFVLSLAPQLDAYRDMIWSKLAHRLRDRRFKKKLKTQRGLKTD